jgi:hypothetical protein
MGLESILRLIYLQKEGQKVFPLFCAMHCASFVCQKACLLFCLMVVTFVI